VQKEQGNDGIETHVSTVEARSGSRTPVTRNILVVSLIMVVGLLIVAVGFGYFKTDQTGADGVNGSNSTQPSNNAG
jgi:hypothetical protein